MTKPGYNKGRFTKDEIAYIKRHYQKQTDKEMALALNRVPYSVQQKRLDLGLIKDDPQIVRNTPGKNREAYLDAATDNQKRKQFEKEIKKSAQFKAMKDSLSKDEQDLYVEKFVEFMMDPTIETMTSMEKDTLHNLNIAVIRMNRYLRQEKDSIDKASKDPTLSPISRGKEIRECEEIFLKCQESLNVSRKQRLKDGQDQSINFVNLIKDLKNPNTRLHAGREAAMFRYIGMKKYNDMLGSKIISGRPQEFDIDGSFKEKPKGELNSKFIETAGDVE